jgi:hypothetical protein
MCAVSTCRSQQPLVVQLLKGMQGACSTAAALTPALTPAADRAAAAGVADEDRSPMQRQRQQDYLAVPLLLDQLLRLLLPLPSSYHTMAVAGGSGSSGATAAPEQQQQQQQQALDLTEAQQQSAVQLLQQLLAAGLLQQQDALLLLCLQPLQSIWQQQQQQPEQAMHCRYSHSQLRLMLQLTESLLRLDAVNRGAAAAVLNSESDSSCSWAAQHAECMCPLVCTARTAAALAAPAAADAPHAGQQQSVAVVRWLLLGLCQIQQQLQQAAWLDHRPDYKGTCQTGALLEAVVLWLAEHGESARLLLLQGDKAQQQQQQQQQLVGLMVEELQQLTWQQRLLISCLLRPQQQEDATASGSDSSSSSSSGGEAVRSRLLLPDSLASMPSNGSSSSRTAQAPMQLAQARQLLLDCCEFAAISNAHALLLAQQCIRMANPAAARHAVDPAHQPQLIQRSAIATAAALAAAVQQLPWQQLRQGLTLALGQFLPWAAEHQAARVLLRLLPALLQSTLGQHLQHQQQQQGVTAWSGALGAVDTSNSGLQPLQQQLQQQPARKVTAALWCAELQLVVRAAFLFLQHGNWAQPQAAARSNSSRGSGASGVEQARQLAAEQCFRHVSLLVLHVASQAKQGLASAAAVQPGSASCGADTKQAATQPDNGAADDQASLQLVQVCVQELCRLAAALSGCVECSSLQVLLLQLLQQLIAGTGGSRSAAADVAGARSTADAARSCVPRPPPPVPAAVAVPATADGADQSAAQTVQQEAAANNIMSAPGVAEDQEPTAHAAAVQFKVDGAGAADAGSGTQTLPSGWQDTYACTAVTYGRLLAWVGQQLQLLPQQMQQLLVPAVVHMAEQQLAGLLGRSLEEKEAEDLERMVWVA